MLSMLTFSTYTTFNIFNIFGCFDGAFLDFPSTFHPMFFFFNVFRAAAPPLSKAHIGRRLWPRQPRFNFDAGDFASTTCGPPIRIRPHPFYILQICASSYKISQSFPCAGSARRCSLHTPLAWGELHAHEASTLHAV